MKLFECNDGHVYNKILVAFSGGKDSLACILHLLELGIDPSCIELHHHEIDDPNDPKGNFMDWPVTPDYCRKVAEYLKLPIYFSYREGGFRGEMYRDDQPTGKVKFENPDSTWGETGGKGPNGTRGFFPQVSPNLAVRWCSAYLKIDVMRRLITNSPRFNGINTLVITGERAEESPNRARYKQWEPHFCNSNKRRVMAYRPLLHASEKDVWDLIKRFNVRPHPAYQLGWGRLSCLSCIFGSPNQWASIRKFMPEHFREVEEAEKKTGKTIQRKGNVRDLADKGTPYKAGFNEDLLKVAMGKEFTLDPYMENWEMPTGAFGEKAGPV